MRDINNNLYSYFTSREIKIASSNFKNVRKVSLDEFKMQIDNIIMFQNSFKGYKDNILPRIGGAIGKDFESYKLQVKRLELDLERISEKIDKEIVDIFLLEEGERLLNLARIAIAYVENSNYKNLIRRSMKNYEVCLGKVDESNMRINESGKLEIRTIKYLAYNLVEQDLYYYLKYIKKRNNNIDLEYLINYFVQESLLEDDSREYLKGLISYPVESLKLWDRYLKSKKNLTEKQYIDGFYRAKIIDSNELIDGGGLFFE